MEGMDSGQGAREGMMGAAESFLRYFLAEIAAIIIFMNYGWVFMRITPLFLRFTQYSIATSVASAAGEVERSPVSCAKTGESPDTAQKMTSVS